MKRLNSLVLCCLMLFVITGCNTGNTSNEEADQKIELNEQKITSKDIERINFSEYVLSPLSDKAVSNWLKFQEVLTQIELLKKGNLSFFKDDKTMLQSVITDLKNEIPEALNDSSILVRVSVLETTILKLEGILNIHNVEKGMSLKAIKEVLVAHSNLILQINKKFEKDSQNIQKPN